MSAPAYSPGDAVLVTEGLRPDSTPVVFAARVADPAHTNDSRVFVRVTDPDDPENVVVFHTEDVHPVG